MSSPATREPEVTTVADPTEWADRNRAVVTLGLAWARQLLQARIARLRRSNAPDPSLPVSDDLVTDLKADWLLREAGVEAWAEAATPALLEARRAYDDARRAMRETREPAALDRLSMIFGLAPFDEDVLLLALAPRVDAAFQALYGYVHDRPAITRATPHLVLALLASDAAARAEALGRLGPAAPLRRWVLVSVDEAGADALGPLEIDERMSGYLLGRDELDGRARACLRPVPAGPAPARHAAVIGALTATLANSPRPAAFLVGPRASGRRAVAVELAARLGLGLAELEPRAVPADPIARQARLAVIAREARLARFAVLVDLTPPVARPGADDPERSARDAADTALAALDALVIVTGEDRVPLAVPVPTAHLQPLDADDRVAIWRRVLGPRGPQAPAVIAALADQFVLDPDEIAAIGGGSGEVDGGALWSACRHAAGRGLDSLAERIEPRFGWDDIVLPAAVRHDLAALIAQVRHRLRVYRDWGFARRLPRGRGVTALFAGPSGVGKTMAAEVIAGQLDLDLYRIDLSSVVSKYIGETEKNLRRVFDAAEAGGAVLFFDEADALFGKRTEVRDSHDRYANIEVSYLLQRMEAYAGLAILATNLKSHLDTAFLRRLRYVIDIPFPDASHRRAIWARAFPPEAPTRDLDLEALARLEIAGGNITVIAVNAAFLAAADERPIDMSHVARAARAEFRKLDKELRAAWAEAR